MNEAEFQRLKQGKEIKQKLEDVRGSVRSIKEAGGEIHVKLINIVYGTPDKEIKLGFFSEKECIKTLELMLENKIIELEKEFEEL